MFTRGAHRISNSIAGIMKKTLGFTYRFGVGDPTGPRSGEWRVWADRGKSDVYVAAVTIAQMIKVSLHPSGSCNSTLTSDALRAEPSDAPLRGIRERDLWTRAAQGTSVPLRIRFPAGELRPVGLVPSADTVWIPRPAPGHAVTIACHFTPAADETHDPGDTLDSDDDAWPGQSEGSQLLMSAALQNGETFWVTASVASIPNGLNATIAQQRERAALTANSRLLFGESLTDHERVLTDAAAQLP